MRKAQFVFLITLIISSVLTTIIPFVGLSLINSNTTIVTKTITISQNELQSGVTAAGYLDTTHDSDLYTIQIPSYTSFLHCILTCPSDTDFDVYGRLGIAPTTDAYDWRGFSSTGEDVTYNTPTSGTWYILVRSWSGIGSYELTITLNEVSPPSSSELEDGVTVSSSLYSSDVDYWTIFVDQNVTSIRTVLSCGANDFDIRARRDNIPTYSQYDWSATAIGGEDYTYEDPGSGNWIIMVYIYSGQGSYELTVHLRTGPLPGWIDWLTEIFFTPIILFPVVICCIGACVKSMRSDPDPIRPTDYDHETHEPSWPGSHDELTPIYCMYCGTRIMPNDSTCRECGAILPRTGESRSY